MYTLKEYKKKKIENANDECLRVNAFVLVANKKTEKKSDFSKLKGKLNKDLKNDDVDEY